jgi:hypothetical protein
MRKKRPDLPKENADFDPRDGNVIT